MMTERLSVGDMIVYMYRSDHPYVGLIKKISTNKWGHQNNVYIHWQGETPVTYNVEYGFAGANIINHRQTFNRVAH